MMVPAASVALQELLEVLSREDTVPIWSSGDGQWRDGKHIPGPQNQKLERELFGVPNDPKKPNTGINFANYNIPVEASGQNVLELVNAFTNPLLDEHLLRNSALANEGDNLATGSCRLNNGGLRGFVIEQSAAPKNPAPQLSEHQLPTSTALRRQEHGTVQVRCTYLFWECCRHP